MKGQYILTRKVLQTGVVSTFALMSAWCWPRPVRSSWCNCCWVMQRRIMCGHTWTVDPAAIQKAFSIAL